MTKIFFIFLTICISSFGFSQSNLAVPELGTTYELDNKVYPVQKLDKQYFIKRDNGDTLFFTIVEQMPEYPGGQQEMFKFLGSNMTYPSKAKNKGIEGTIIISFVVGKDGVLKDIHAIKWKNELLKNEAERVVKLMPKWTSGYQKGKPVSVSYNLPIYKVYFTKKEKKVI